MSASNWSWLNFYLSTDHVQTYLHKSYLKENIENAEKWSYENCYAFIYYLEHGQNYYITAEKAPISIQPVLLFYGYIQLMKACLLTTDATYPESAAVLSHGVTTRKRKKKQYQFLHDQIKIQKNGLFTHFFSKMFHVEHLENEKYSMEMLLQHIPEMNALFSDSFNRSYHYPINKEGKRLFIPLSIIDQLKMTVQHFSRFIKQILHPDNIMITDDHFILELPYNPSPISSIPLLYHYQEESFFLPKNKPLLTSNLNELMVHYLLLYNLSMICRYETEWWGDIRHHFSHHDFPFIMQFLQTTKEKIPFYISLLLHEKRVNP
ncbi:YaaC family protein [Bacillus tianshenii]|nr:YaaC family protein [Bacillus tianshenii]